MTRLTKAIKQQIVSNALKQAGVGGDKEALRLRRVEHAEAVRVECLGGVDAVDEIEKTVKKIKK